MHMSGSPPYLLCCRRRWCEGDGANRVHGIKSAPQVASQIAVEMREAYEAFRSDLIFRGDEPELLKCDQGDIVIVSSEGADIKQAIFDVFGLKQKQSGWDAHAHSLMHSR